MTTSNKQLPWLTLLKDAIYRAQLHKDHPEIFHMSKEELIDYISNPLERTNNASTK